MRKHESRRPEINVTPLVDVVLVLLIIFMVVTPQLESGAAVDLPAVENPDAPTEGSLTPIVVSVTRGGDVFLERDPIARERLRDRLAAVRDEDPDRAVLLKGDRDAPYEQVRPVLELVQELGFPGAALQVGDRRAENQTEEG